MKTPSLQDLYDEADKNGIRVLDHPLPGTLCGLWDWHNETVWLETNLSDTQRRCVLCHELVHAHYGDTTCLGSAGGFNEARCRKQTALLLISPVEYALAERIYGSDVWHIACELGVTTSVVKDYRKLLHELGTQFTAYKTGSTPIIHNWQELIREV